MQTAAQPLRILMRCLAAAYGALMLWLLFGRPVWDVGRPYWTQVWESCNFVPFYTIREFLGVLSGGGNPYLARHAVINLAGNVVMFIPLGFFLPCLWRGARTLRRTLLYSAGLITLIEIAQALTLRGSGDIDDLILNLAGAAVGYGLFRAARALYARGRRGRGQ